MTFDSVVQLAQIALKEGWIDLKTYTHGLIGLDRLPPDALQRALSERFGLREAQLQLAQELARQEARSHVRAQTLLARLAHLQNDRPRTQPGQVAGRYLLGDEIGRGGGGRVLLGEDRLFGRQIAIKFALDEKRDDPSYIERFIAEAQATGSLEHPNIIPVHDIGILADGAVFYTMKYVGKNSLRLIIHRLRLRKADTLAEFGLIRLLTLFNQVCMAVDYAHAKGVIHRDLKPENILLGDHGEVIVMDWGLAKFFGQQEEASPLKRGRKTPANTVLGTPEYMAPEQAMGMAERPAVDIYALGAILYELLCLSPPFEDDRPVQVLLKAIKEKPLPPSVRAQEHQRNVPAALEQIALTAIAKDPEARYPSAKALRDAVEAYIENRRDEERTQTLAAERVQEAALLAQRLRHLDASAADLQAQIHAARREFEGWEPLHQKAHLWEAEAALDHHRADAIAAFGAVESAYLQALAYDRDNADARRGLALLYWERLQHAERDERAMDALYYQAMIRRYDNGQLTEHLLGRGVLHLHTQPEGALVTLRHLDERDLRLQPDTAWGPQPAPIAWGDLPMGAYLAEAALPGYANATLSFRITRGAEVHLHLPLLPTAHAPADLLYIPPGPVRLGGDPQALDPLPPADAWTDAFFIAPYPVTFAEYLEFINYLDQINPELAIEHMPRTKGDGILCQRTAGGYQPVEHLILGPARQRYPSGQGYEWFLPVFGVSWFDALAYLRWRSERDARAYRLPSEIEWERAARGGDGRRFPWGDRFDPTLCKMARSRPEPAQPEPVGVFEDDASPFGARDMAGGVQEWTADLFAPPAAHAHHDPHLATLERVVRGGAWPLSAVYARAASRTAALPDSREPHIGFRVAMTPPAP